MKTFTEESISFLLPPPLSEEVALQLAATARVPTEQHETFFNMVHWTISLVWMRDIRSIGVDPAQLVRVAEAARALHQEFEKLDPLSTQWVERLRRQTPWYSDRLHDAPETVFRFAHLFSSAAGLSPPRSPGGNKPKHQKSGRDKTRADVIFLDFGLRLKMVALQNGGRLGLDPALKRGTLVEAIKLLKVHLPAGVVPAKFPFSAFKKIKGAALVLPIPEIVFYSPEPTAASAAGPNNNF